MTNPTPSPPDQSPKQNRSFRLTLPGGRNIGCGGCLLVAILAIGGFVVLLNLTISLAPYKVYCDGAGSVANSGTGDRASADAYAREQEQKGMSCRKDYP